VEGCTGSIPVRGLALQDIDITGIFRFLKTQYTAVSIMPEKI